MKACVFLGIFCSVASLLALWLKARSGAIFPWHRWAFSAVSGFIVATFVYGVDRYERSCRRYIEIQGNRIRLGTFGPYVAMKRVRAFTITPEPASAACHRVTIAYTIFMERKPRHWSMLVDDPAAALEFERFIQTQTCRP